MSKPDLPAIYRPSLTFLCTQAGEQGTFAAQPAEMVVAGWAGRNLEAIEHHIAELAAIGVPRPSSVPLFYRVSVQALTQADSIEVAGEETSGEVEPLLLVHGGERFISVASDHTDRKLEAHSVALSKQICAKPVGRQAWRWEEVKAHWDEVVLRAWIVEADGKGGQQQTLYQEGAAGSLRSPEELLAQYLDGRTAPDGLVMSCGTVGTIGAIRPASALRIALHDPVLQREISHTYSVRTLPVVA